jgi:hypothetical protein
MTTDRDAPAPFYCPRCGGLMYKPQGSAFYWHADNNHPPCEITNIAEQLASAQPAREDSPGKSSQGRPRKKNT